MIKLLYITNIPALYRQKRFNTMARIFPEYGIDFEVLYMAKIEPNRNWIIPAETYQYQHRFFKGIHPSIGNFYAHFNPSLLFRLLKNDYQIAVVGGMASPTHWLAPFFISKKKKQLMSVESNLHSVERKTGFGAWMKNKLLRKADAFQVTGTPQIEYIRFFDPSSANKTFIKMPNLIDEDIFVTETGKLRENRENLRQAFGVAQDEQMWVLPARLTEIKGIIPFLDFLDGVEGVKLFILGDGDQEKQIQQMIDERQLPVTLVGFVQQETVIRYYAAADLFVLPSFKDPSPLSPIEASASGLPLLVSARIGNLAEVVAEGVNGWSYDPVDETEKGRAIVKEIAALSRPELEAFGEKSRERYNAFFNTEKCIRDYATSISGLFDKI